MSVISHKQLHDLVSEKLKSEREYRKIETEMTKSIDNKSYYTSIHSPYIIQMSKPSMRKDGTCGEMKEGRITKIRLPEGKSISDLVEEEGDIELVIKKYLWKEE